MRRSFKAGFTILTFFQFIPVYGNGAEKPSVFHLSNILQNKNLVGLDFDSPEYRLASELEVQGFIHYRNKVLSKDQVLARRVQCSGPESEKSPFCPLVLNPKFGKLYEIDPAIRRGKNKKAKVLVRSVERGDLEGVLRLSETTPETDLSQAFRFVKSSQVMADFAEKVLKQDHCSSNPLLVALGLRLENEFPAVNFKLLAEALYKKAYHCGKDQSSVAAGYRLGLFHIWSNRCDRAEEVLANIPESPHASHPIDSFPIDYRMRIDYWRAVCAELMKNTSLRDTLKTKVLRSYPLSLHALILAENSKNWEAQLTRTFDPEIVLRGNKKGHEALPRITRNVEVLLLRGENETAAILLREAIPQVLKEEIPFRLYWSVLLQRAGDRANSFNLIAHIFRHDPSLISKSTLQLLYPMEQFDKIQKSDPQGDPFLILSLVRQESAFDVDARSSAGAQGLMQLQWPTARQFERVSAKQLRDPQVNLRVGVKYLKKLEKRFSGRLDHALAAYNAGPERIKVWSKRYSTPDPLLFLDLLPLQETRDYVSAIARNYYWYKRLYVHQLLSAGSTEGGEKLLLLLGLHVVPS